MTFMWTFSYEMLYHVYYDASPMHTKLIGMGTHTLVGNYNQIQIGSTWLHVTHCPNTSPCLEEDTFNGNEAYPNLLGPVAMTQTTTQFLQKCIHPIHKLDKSGVVLISWRQVALLYPLYKIDSFTLDKDVPLHDVFRTTKMTNETHVRIK